MDSQEEDLGLHGMWVYLYFGFMVLCSLTGSFIVFLHWKKYLQWEQRAQQWVEAVKASSFIYSPHVSWVNEVPRYQCNYHHRPSPDLAKTEIKVEIPDSPWELHTQGQGLCPQKQQPQGRGAWSYEAPVVVLQQPTSNRMPQGQTRSPFLIPIFQAIPFDGSLHHIPPMLACSASYPLDIYPKRKVRLHSLPRRALVGTVSM